MITTSTKQPPGKTVSNGWMVTFPVTMLTYSKLIDAFVLAADRPLFIDGVNFPEAIAITGGGPMPPVLEKMGLTVLRGVIPETWQRPKFDGTRVWLQTSDGVESCMGTHHVGPIEFVMREDKQRCTACLAMDGKLG